MGSGAHAAPARKERDGARRSPGLRIEVLTSLALLMALASITLAAVVFVHHEGTLRTVLGRALLAEARREGPPRHALYPDTDWWVFTRDGRAVPRGAVSAPIDPATREMAESSRTSDTPLLRPGSFAGRIPLRGAHRKRGGDRRRAPPAPRECHAACAAPGGHRGDRPGERPRVHRVRCSAPASPARDTARTAGGVGARGRATKRGFGWPKRGPARRWRVARALNEAYAALAARTDALSKAVVELRDANRELRETRATLDRAERLAATGQLAAGVAHESRKSHRRHPRLRGTRPSGCRDRRRLPEPSGSGEPRGRTRPAHPAPAAGFLPPEQR